VGAVLHRTDADGECRVAVRGSIIATNLRTLRNDDWRVIGFNIRIGRDPEIKDLIAALNRQEQVPAEARVHIAKLLALVPVKPTNSLSATEKAVRLVATVAHYVRGCKRAGSKSPKADALDRVAVKMGRSPGEAARREYFRARRLLKAGGLENRLSLEAADRIENIDLRSRLNSDI
jgi:hypothetical protein